MFGIFEQPEDYSQVLRRIGLSTTAVGVACTSILVYAYPPARAKLFGDTEQFELEILSAKWLVLMIPLLVAIVARIVTLHDYISDLFRIRRTFDFAHILTPLANGVGYASPQKLVGLPDGTRHKLMRAVFYEYAPDAKSAKINSQYVRNAFDAWGWFWCFVEAVPVAVLAVLVAVVLRLFFLSYCFGIVAFAFALIAYCSWGRCVRAADREVQEILDNTVWRADILSKFNAI